MSTPALPLPITLSQLESYLWDAANILRGSPVDRTDWKSYILPLLFFKRICDVWDEEHAQKTDAGFKRPDRVWDRETITEWVKTSCHEGEP